MPSHPHACSIAVVGGFGDADPAVGYFSCQRQRPAMEDWKPLIFLNGVRISFPPPTKHIKAPKATHPRAREGRRAGGSAGPFCLWRAV